MKRFRAIFSVLLAVILLCGMLPTQRAAAVETENEYMTMQDAAAYVRKEFAEFKTDVEVKFFFEDPDFYTETELVELFLAEVLKHTGVPDEGDYMRWSFQQWGQGAEESFDGKTHYVTVSIKPTYNNTAEQEQALERKLDQVFASLDLDGKSDYEKVKAIYEYVCENVVYSEEVLSSGADPLSPSEDQRVYYSAYGALVLGSTTCQGFSSLVYRMMLKAGIDCRLIAGGAHGWNIVKLDGKYYYLDPTWDSDNFHLYGELEYFLDGSASFRTGGAIVNNSASAYDHITWTDQFTAEFLDQYPISVLDYGEEELLTGDADDVLGSGRCGDKARWTLTGDGTLTISGTGSIWDAPDGTFWNLKNERWDGLNGYITKVVIQKGITAIGDYAFMNCPRLTEVSIASSVKSIGVYAFGLCENLTQIALPDTVKTVGSNAFYQCVRLENATLSAGMKEVPKQAFMGCTALKTVQIPNGIRKIGSAAFVLCTSLQGVEIPASVTTLGDSAFAEAFDPAEKITLTVPETVTEIQGACFEASGLYEVKLNASIDQLDSNMFHLCHDLRSVELPDTIQSFAGRTFHGCANLRDINLPVALKELGEYAFWDCKALQSVELPVTLETIPDSTFWDCTSLEEIAIPAAVREIGNGAFADCESLKKVTIPASVRKVGDFAFSKCKNLTTVVFEGSAPKIGINPFAFVENITVFYPGNNATWTQRVLDQLAAGGIVTFVSAHGANDPHTTVWCFDDSSHWKQCAGCDYKEESAGHSFDSNCTCQDCGYACHNYQWKWVGAAHWQLCTACGAVTEQAYHILDGETCIDCGFVLHSFVLERNEESHWKKCEICGATEEAIPHRFNGGDTCFDCAYACADHNVQWQWTAEDHSKQCSKCGSIETQGGHSFDSDNICTECGYARTASHEDQQQEPGNEDQQQEPGNEAYLWIALGIGLVVGVVVLLKKKKAQ